MPGQSTLNALERAWYEGAPSPWWTIPASWVFAAVSALRREAHRRGWLANHAVGCPVVVVGNIAVGGTGKTPLIIWLARFLAGRGWRPGIVTRGYGGRAAQWPVLVEPDSDPAEVGDEPVLLAGNAGCPVAAGPDRVRAAQLILAQHDCDIILSDDGLQHYRLRREVEIAVVDGVRLHGNGRLLPAGPLREPPERLATVDLVVVNGDEVPAGLPCTGMMHLAPGPLVDLNDPARTQALDDLAGKPVHAVCGIGHPARFFAVLKAAKLKVIEHPMPDHHAFVAADFKFAESHPVVLTEKDAVKCRPLGLRDTWFLPVEAQPDEAVVTALSDALARLPRPRALNSQER